MPLIKTTKTANQTLQTNSPISFICASRTEEDQLATKFSVQNSLRREVEWLPIIGKNSIFEAYNEGIEKASNNVLCFLHDDVTLLCNDWVMDKVCQQLDLPFTGMIGAAGATKIPADGCWWRQDHMNLRGMVAHKNDTDIGIGFNSWPWQQAQFGKVAIIDGCIMFSKKETLRKIGGFNNSYYSGFHFYDLDTSLHISMLNRNNYVLPIPILHGSVGQTSDNWEENRIKFVNKWSLPYAI